MVWGVAWLSSPPVALASSRLLRLLRLRLLSMEVMLEEEVVRDRARRVIPADGTAEQGGERQGSGFRVQWRRLQCGGTETTELAGASACKTTLKTQRGKENTKKLMADEGGGRASVCSWK